MGFVVERSLLKMIAQTFIILTSLNTPIPQLTGLAWFATRHPYLAAAIVFAFLAIIIVLIHWVVRALRALFRGAERSILS